MIPRPLSAPSGAIFGATAGIARKLDAIVTGLPKDTPGAIQGGGDLNGTQATSIMFSHAGTAAERISVPRAAASNFCGIV